MKKLLLAGAAVGLIAAAPANAAPIVALVYDGGVSTNLALTPFAGSLLFSFDSGGGVSFSGQMKSNSPGTSALASLFSVSLDFSNTSALSHTIKLTISDTGFTAPVSSSPTDAVNVTSSIGGSVTTGSPANTLSYSSYLNPLNTNAPGGTQVGPGTPSITTSGSSYSDTKGTAILGVTGPYSLVQELSITIGAGTTAAPTSFGYQGQTSVTVPEPMTLGLLGAGLLGLAAVRRRKA